MLAWPAKLSPFFVGAAALCAGLLCQLMAHRSHHALLRVERPRPAALGNRALPIRRMSASYHALAGDILYLRAVNVFGSKLEARRGFPTLASLLTAASDADERASAPYLLAGTALPFVTDQAGAALDLLARGTKLRPDLWRLHLSYGFVLSRSGRYLEASQALAKAAALPGAPPFVALLATRLAAEGDDAALALAMLDELAATVDDEGLLAALAERRAPLVYQLQLAELSRGAAAMLQATGHRPKTVHELIEAMPAADLPATDPWGARYRFDATGCATSDNSERLLRLYRPTDAGEARP